MKNQITTTFNMPLIQLIQSAIKTHQNNFDSKKIQKSTLCSVKTGGCPENCNYCSQSAHYKTNINKTPLLSIEQVKQNAISAKKDGAERFCMGAAWREIKDGPQFDQIIEMVKEVKKIGLETCCTLGMLNELQAKRLKEAGLDYYNHNIDTSPEYYSKIIQTRNFEDRLNTISTVRESGIKVCTGGIIGLGESQEDRISFIEQLTILNPQPESISINLYIPTEGTPLANLSEVDFLDIVRVICTIRIYCEKSVIRLSAGRNKLSDEQQLILFLTGINSIFLGEKLLTTANRSIQSDDHLFSLFGLENV